MTNRQALELIRAHFPAVWRQIKRRVFRGVENYHSADIAYIHQAGSLAGIRGSGDKQDDLRSAAQLQVQYGSPIFFITQPLLDAAANTELPEFIDWSSLHVPFPAGTFILPLKSGYTDPTGSYEVAILDYALYQTHDAPQLLLTMLDANSLGYSVWFEGNDGHSKRFRDACLRVFFTILFAMAARPEYVESGRRLGTHKKSGADIWSPNIVGRKYATKRSDEVGTHASPKMHWRRGHFRYQPYGSGREQRKVIWIEPMLIAAPQVMTNAA